MVLSAGLALDGQGRLVTLANAFYGVDAEIQSFDIRSPLRAVSKFPYEPDFVGNRTLLKPRFIAADGDLLAVTDLGKLSFSHIRRLSIHHLSLFVVNLWAGSPSLT